MKKTFPSLRDWTFDVDEVSAGVYEVIGRNRLGQAVSAKGTDPDKLLDECKESATKASYHRPKDMP